MPAGGYFSTVSDVGRFCRMMLNGGNLGDKRILSEKSVKEMTTKQTAEAVKDNYGLGWSVGTANFGHGGALSTNMSVDTKRGLVYVYLVQQAGIPGDGAKAQGEFRKAADALYSK